MKKMGNLGILALAIALSGCAGLKTPGNTAGVRVVEQATTIPVEYDSEVLKQQLSEMGLLQPFTDYWAAYTAKDWAGRYRMEEFQKPQEEQFYVSYHAAAWELLALRMEAVDASGAPERVRINLRGRFRNPQRPEQERTTFLQDLWAKRDKGWVHVNSDPMLNGLRGVK